MALSCSKNSICIIKRVTSKHDGDFHCLDCLHFFRRKNKLESHKRVCKKFCSVIISSEDTKILKFNQYQKSDKAAFVIYVDLEYIKDKINGCKNNPESLSITKVSNNIPSGF